MKSKENKVAALSAEMRYKGKMIIRDAPVRPPKGITLNLEITQNYFEVRDKKEWLKHREHEQQLIEERVDDYYHIY